MSRTRLPNPRVKSVLEFIQKFWAEHGYSPAVRDIADHLNTSTSVANYYLDELERDQKISRTPQISRSIVLLRQPAEEV